MRKKVLALAGAVAVAAVPAVSALAGTRTIKVGDKYYISPGRPHTISISKGSTLRWHFIGRRRHNVTEIRGPGHFASPDKRHGYYSHTFNRRGTYVLVCTIHGGKQKMTVHVR